MPNGSFSRVSPFTIPWGFFMAPRLEGPGTSDVLVSEGMMFVYVLGVVCIGTEIKVMVVEDILRGSIVTLL